MKAILSTTHDPMYQFFLPITTWCFNKIGIDVVCFVPKNRFGFSETARYLTARDTMHNIGAKIDVFTFDAPKHKEATYAQCSRLFAHGVVEDKNEQLVIGDVDMLNFQIPPTNPSNFCVWGYDLTPPKQYPMCYISAPQYKWQEAFGKYGDNPQECLDNLLGNIESASMRSDYWGKDQETAYNEISPTDTMLIPRAREGTQFATHRIDRDDSYFMDRLNLDVVDYHCHRPGYTAENAQKIVDVLTYMYPLDDHSWILEYARKYRELL